MSTSRLASRAHQVQTCINGNQRSFMSRAAALMLMASTLLVGGCPANQAPAEQSGTQDMPSGSSAGDAGVRGLPGRDTATIDGAPTTTDRDSDGVLDRDEPGRGADPSSTDSDADGLTDAMEIGRGTDPALSDSDGDGLSDKAELDGGTSPTSPDTDADGLPDGGEIDLGTDPTNADTDGDGLGDMSESSAGTDPNSADTDGDGLSDYTEVQAGTNPSSGDTDADGLFDANEAVHGTNPLLADSDGDGLWDGTEVLSGLDPLIANEVGFVISIHSVDVISIASSSLAVWFSGGPDGEFFLWQPGDIVAIARVADTPSVALIGNITLGDIASAVDRGTLVVDGYITDWSIVDDWIAVNGIRWDLNPFDAYRAYFWRWGDHVLVTVDNPLGLDCMINLTRGEDVLLAP